MSQNAALNSFVKSRPYLVWYVKDIEQLSESSIVEHTLNYGNWRDVQELVALLGREKTAEIYSSQRKGKRNNYRPTISHYFDLYFSRHATC